MLTPNARQIRFLKILLHAGFLVSGISTVLIGQVLPVLSQKLALNDRQAGDFFIWQFAGSLGGTLLTNWFGKRDKFILATVFGCFLMALGAVLLNSDSYQICLFAFLINGLGIGMTLPSVNMLILELNPRNSGSALSFLNFFWGIGAIISQPFVDFFGRGTDITIPTLGLAASLLLIGVLIIFQPKEIERKTVSSGEVSIDFDVKIWSQPFAWAIALFGFVHVGFESAMGGWLKTYTQRLEGVSVWFPPIFLYFLFFVAGRGVAPVFFRYLSENKMLILSLLVILLGMGILLFSENVLGMSFGASIAGFGTSSVFPTNIARFTKTFGASATRRATPLFISGTLGSALITWIIGFLSNRNNDLRSGMFVLLFSIVFLIVLQIVLSLPRKNV